MSREINSKDAYLSRLLKLVPTEIIAAYMAIIGLIAVEDQKIGLTVAAIILFFITPVYLWRVQKIKSVLQIVVSTVSFAIWVYSIGVPFTFFGLHFPWLSTIILFIWTVFVPKFLDDKSTIRTPVKGY